MSVSISICVCVYYSVCDERPLLGLNWSLSLIETKLALT